MLCLACAANVSQTPQRGDTVCSGKQRLEVLCCVKPYYIIPCTGKMPWVGKFRNRSYACLIHNCHKLTRGFLKNSYLAKFFLKYSRLSVSIPPPDSTSMTDSWSSIVLSRKSRREENQRKVNLCCTDLEPISENENEKQIFSWPKMHCFAKWPRTKTCWILWRYLWAQWE